MVRRVSGRVWVVFTKYAKVFTLQRILSETGMDSGEGLQDPPGLVDPEVRAYVYSLVSALGGTGAGEHGSYVLGDDALACLKDLKKWLKLHDEKSNRLDVVRCIAEANLVKGDLLEILAAWPQAATEDRIKLKVALACLELLVPLTWPIEKIDMQMTVNHHRHIPYLQFAQAYYKHAILEHDSASILRMAVRVGLPSMALPVGERGPRDEGIIKLLLYFFRNVVMISPSLNLRSEGKESEISRSATIEAFHCQDVLALLLTISSNIGEDFNTQDIVIMEILFHLLKGVDVERLFMDKQQLRLLNGDELKYLLAQEAGMHRGYTKNAPTRHNRFGTMIWVERDGPGKVSTVSGQDVLKNGEQTLSKMDQSKKWNKPKQKLKNEEPTYDRFDMRVPLRESATSRLRAFVEEFLDSSFNPLFNHIRRAIEREAERVLEAHQQQFFYLVSWFLQAERIRRRSKKEAEKETNDKKIAETFEPDSFGLIATVLNQESFILLNRFMQNALELKSWREVHAGIRCFTQILLIVQDMSESPLEEDQEIAENIQNRIFYEESTHDRIIAILRGYKDQGFGYLDSCTELSHVFLRMLERYSRVNVDLQVRSKRRARKSKRAAAKQRGETNDDDEDQTSEVEDMQEAERVSKERKFDFTRFSNKFMTQACIDTFVAFARYYIDLDMEQLKRAHRFFYRVAFKQDLSIMLFRLDIIALLTKMTKGPEGLNPVGPTYKEWDELVTQLIRRMIKKLDERPELAVELLFSKINSTTFYLEYGYEKQTVSSKPRPPTTLEVRGSMTIEEQIGIAVAALHDDNLELIDWVIKTLGSAADERQSWEVEASARPTPPQPDASVDQPELVESASKAPSIVVTPNSESTGVAMFKDAKLRLLMTLSGFERLGVDDEPGATWIIPSYISTADLRHKHDIVEQHRKHPTFEYGEDDPVTAEEMLRRKPTEHAKRAEYDDDSDGDGIVSDTNMQEDFLFPPGGPTNKANPHEKALSALKKKRRKRNSVDSDSEDGIDDDTREERRQAREKADLEKRWKIKSAEFVKDSDDESDEERDRAFFAGEEARRKGQSERVREALMAGKISKMVEGEKIKPTVKSTKRKSDGAGSTKTRKKRKEGDDENVEPWRKSRKESVDLTDDDVDAEMGNASSPPQSRGRRDDSSQSGNEDTPLSSPPLEGLSLSKATDDLQIGLPSLQDSTTKVLTLALESGNDDDEEGNDAVPVSTAKRRGRVAVLEDSDDE